MHPRPVSRIAFLFCVLLSGSTAQALEPVYELSKPPGSAANAPQVIAYGADSGDAFGSYVYAGDLNGDGVSDLIVAATSADSGSPVRENAGVVYVWFGKGALAGMKDAAAAAGGAPDVRILGANAADNLSVGRVLTLGDLNGDGTTDLIIGAWRADGPAGGRPLGGEAYIIFGRKAPAVFPAEFDLAIQGSGGADVTLYGATASDGVTIGGALMTGDFNGDGTADLVLGAADADGPANARSAAGEAYLVFGRKSPAVFPATLDLGLSGSAGADVTIYGRSASDRLTARGAVAAGDVNGDGLRDLILGAPSSDGPAGTRADTGAAYIIFGRQSPAAFPATIDLAAAAGGGFITIYGAAAFDGLTTSAAVATGDVNGDGTADLLLGASQADRPGSPGNNSGKAYVVFGRKSPDTFPAVLDLAVQGNNGANVTLYGGSNLDFLTAASTVGPPAITSADLNGDGTADIVLAASAADGPGNTRSDSGEVYIVFGRKSPDAFPAVLDLGVQGRSGADVTLYAGSEGDVLGGNGAITSADFNGDGVADLFLGASGAGGPGDAHPNAGEAYLIFGRKSPADFPLTLDLNVQGSGGADVVIHARSAGDRLSLYGALAAGDFNGDGGVDLLLGAGLGHGPVETRLTPGEAYVIYGTPAAPAAVRPEFTDFHLSIPPVGGSGWRVQAAAAGFTGPVGGLTELQHSEDLSRWTTFATATTAADGTVSFDAIDTLAGEMRYYRIVSQ